MPQRAQSKPALTVLLDLWHGDEHCAGWASPTLALNVAKLSRPSSAKHLGEIIYARNLDEHGNPAIPLYDKELVRILNKGYTLYRDGR